MRNSVLDFETLRLMKAFEKIRDPHARRVIIKVVEAAAKGAVLRVEEPRELDAAGAFASGGGSETSAN
jgi:hypothetical protein